MTIGSFSLSRDGLLLQAQLAPWDEAAFGFPVAQITRIAAPSNEAAEAYGEFEAWILANDVRIISARLPHDRLADSMYLERKGFRFVEMALHPQFEDLRRLNAPDDCLAVLPACGSELAALEAIGEQSFRYQRYHVDPRLDPVLADRRYGRWIRASFDHPRQRLLKIMNGAQIVGVFVVESQDSGRVYWHLTAIAPAFQGKGYGRRAWLSVLRYHWTEGANSVATTISAHNTRVLNLYSSLSARFSPPEMTFHWVKEQK
jgi:RimJ/RimL family protein N-acetyltransferase